MAREDEYEKLSALVDEEWHHQDAAVLANLVEDRELKDKFARYHLIGEALRRQTPEKFTEDFAERVSRRVDNLDKKSEISLFHREFLAVAAALVLAIALINVMPDRVQPGFHHQAQISGSAPKATP